MSFYTRKIPTSLDQNANTNLDQDLHSSRESRYTKSEQEVSNWIFAALDTPEAEQREYKDHGYDLIDVLKDGQILCKLGNLLGPNNPTAKFKNSRMPFIQMENILFFLQTCDLIGMQHDEIFQTIDLFERKDPYQVVVTLLSFSRIANERNPCAFPTVIGPRIVKVKPTVPRKPLGLSQR